MHRAAPLLTLALSLTALPVLAQEVSQSNQLSLKGFGVEEAHLQESLKQHLENLEGYIGLYQGQLRELLGEPQRSGVEAEGVPEREAILSFYDFQLTDSNVVHWRVALQNERVVGIQVATTKDPEPIYVGSLAFLEEGGTTIFRGSGSEHRKMTRRKDLIWQVDLTEAEFGAAAILEIGTVKYSTCDLVWDLEKLRETDGFGNALPRDKN